LIAVAEQAVQAAPRRRVGVWIALALSLTLNVCLVGGLVWAMIAIEPQPAPAERFVAVARSLDLTNAQRASLAAFAATAREATASLRDHNAPVMQKVWEEMARPQPDEAAISRLTDEALQNRRTYQSEMTSGLLKFLATLRPEQRNEFTQLAHRHAWEQHRRGLRLPTP
jgi:Spy/CpxP family protein refolding chaperone